LGRLRGTLSTARLCLCAGAGKHDPPPVASAHSSAGLQTGCPVGLPARATLRLTRRPSSERSRSRSLRPARSKDLRLPLLLYLELNPGKTRRLFPLSTPSPPYPLPFPHVFNRFRPHPVCELFLSNRYSGIAHRTPAKRTGRGSPPSAAPLPFKRTRNSLVERYLQVISRRIR
jgi:hypothetical protein